MNLYPPNLQDTYSYLLNKFILHLLNFFYSQKKIDADEIMKMQKEVDHWELREFH